MSSLTAPVAIVGGGPVGMMLALFLDQLAVRSVLFNIEPTTRWHPRGSTHGSRTMEHYRRIKLADAVRQLGLPADHPTDVAYFTRFSEPELARLPMPSTDEVLIQRQHSHKLDQVPEPIHRANQMHVERLLFEHLHTRPNVMMRFGWRVEGFTQDQEGVTLTARNQNSSAEETWRTEYLVGCDGGRSDVRKALGIGFRGDAGLVERHFGGRWFSTYLRASELYQKYLGSRRAWQYWAVNPEVRSTLIAVDGREEFLFRTQARSSDGPPENKDVAELLNRCTGDNLDVEIIGHAPWNAGVALVAERFADRRVLLAGDAVHLFTPTGGFGMNTGIDDVANLSWKLAAMVRGWGGPKLLASYEHERMPIALRNTGAARQLAANINATDIGADIEKSSAAGDSARLAAGSMLTNFRDQFASIGVQLGTRYDGSPIIVRDGAGPSDSFVSYTPTSLPGGRAPHAWLENDHSFGSSLFDRLESGFTLLRLGPSPASADAIIEAAELLRIPLNVLSIPDSDVRDLYERDLVLVRPDQHVGWRGNAGPQDPSQVLRTLVGV